MKSYEYYLFDADGTLIDTSELICKCFENTAKVMGKEYPGKHVVLQHVGLTLKDQMKIYFGPLSDEEYPKYRDIHMNYQLSVYNKYLLPLLSL